MKRQHTVAFATLLSAVTTFAAPTLAQAQAGPVTLRWFMWSGSQAEVAAWEHLCDMVHAKYPNITVQFETASWPDYWTKLTVLAASHQLPDIVSLQSSRTAGFAELMEPLNSYMQRDHFDVQEFNPTIISGLSQQGNLYALPYDFGPLVMYYNADLFQQAGLLAPAPGWTESAFVSDAKALTKDGRYGAALSVPDAMLAYTSSAGANYMSADGQLDLTNPKLVAAFQNYADIVAVDKAAPLLPSSGTPSMAQANARFIGGDVAMYVDGPWDLINVSHSIHFNLGLAPIPAGSAGSNTLVAGSGFGIATTSPNKDAAWEAIQVLTGPDAEQYLAEQGRAFPARTVDQPYWYAVAAKGVANAQPTMAVALKTAAPYQTTASWNTVVSLFEQYAPLAFGGQQSAQKVLTTIQQLALEQ
jgi:ABC-type glycerol-3-phosphate transport system substrate-binding protein